MTHREAVGAMLSAFLPPTECEGELTERRPSIPRAVLWGHKVFRCTGCGMTLGVVDGRIAWYDGGPREHTQGGGTDDL